MASSNKFRCARVKIPPCSTHAFFNLLPGGSYTSSLSSKCLPCLCLNLVSSPSICNKLMICSIHLYITSQLFCMSSLLLYQICMLETGYKLQTVLQALQPDSHVHGTWIKSLYHWYKRTILQMCKSHYFTLKNILTLHFVLRTLEGKQSRDF